METGILKFSTVRYFLTKLKKGFGDRENETIKVAELKKVEQEDRIMKDFV